MTPRSVLCAGLALLCFASNSILCRLALGRREIDAVSFTTVRVLSGALMLVLLTRALDWRSGAAAGAGDRAAGGWAASAALFVYALAFSLAYLRIGAGVGALIAFGAVQVTMIGWGLRRGERPGAAEWIGLAVAFCGLVSLGLQGAGAVDPLGAALMLLAGGAWGVYSLIGRGSARPLLDTAGNFSRATPMALAASVVGGLSGASLGRFHFSPAGVLLAVVSGALTSGVGYSLWYAALPQLHATRAALLQLLVPVLAALGAVAFLGETFTPRLVGAGAAILGGVALALLGRRRAPRP